MEYHENVDGGVIDYPGPMLGEPLPLELANTRYLTRGQPRDGLASAELLAAWLTRVRSRLRIPLAEMDLLEIGDLQVSNARDLRDCIHSLATASAGQRRPDAAVVDRLNRHTRATPLWTELRWEARPDAELCTSATAVTAAICEIAAATVELFAGPHAEDIQPCAAPNCILSFVKDHARREWCSTACGNRVRAARHYARRRHPQT